MLNSSNHSKTFNASTEAAGGLLLNDVEETNKAIDIIPTILSMYTVSTYTQSVRFLIDF